PGRRDQCVEGHARQGRRKTTRHGVGNALVRIHPDRGLLYLVRDHQGLTGIPAERTKAERVTARPWCVQRRNAARSGMLATRSGRGGITLVSRLGVYPGGYVAWTRRASSKSFVAPLTAGPM